jgi:serine protease inhibitor
MYETPTGKGGNMSHEKESMSSSDEKFITRILRYQEGDLSAEELRELNRDLLENPERLAEFTRIHNTSRLAHEAQTAAIPVVSAADLENKKPTTWRRALLPIAACLVVMLGFSIWKSGVDIDPGPIATVTTPVVLDSRWHLVAAEGAKYSIVSPNLVRLQRGELEFSSSAPADLVVETPHAVATAEGTHFLIGHHTETIKPTNQRTTNMKPTKTISRLFVLAGIVTMTNNSGTVKAGENEAAVAGAKGAPEKITVKANSDFAFDLYKQLVKENDGKNLFFSPYSVSGALAMTAEGARGKTAAEMGKVLRFPEATRRTGDDAQRIPWETSQIHTGFGQINARLNEKLSDADRKKIESQIATLQTELKAMQEKASKKWDQKLNAEIAKLVTRIKRLDGKINPPKLAVANALWGEQTFPFREDYLDTISASYKTGGLFPIDFAKNPEPSRLHINSWVEEQTNNRIKDLIPKDDINASTKLVLTNAIYFKGNWTNPFDKKMTRTRDFTRNDGSKVQTPIMFGSLPVKLGRQKIAEDTHVSVAELPYAGDELSMVLITAGRGKPLSTIEKHLSTANLDKWLATLKKGHRDIYVSLPRFKMESKYKLNDTLKAMGMPTAFQRGGADFTGLNESYGKELYISFVHHKGFIDVNEAGTEAAAATAVGIAARSMPPSFDGTRPFIYLIRDNATGTILFMGRMMDPTEK